MSETSQLNAIVSQLGRIERKLDRLLAAQFTDPVAASNADRMAAAQRKRIELASGPLCARCDDYAGGHDEDGCTVYGCDCPGLVTA